MLQFRAGASGYAGGFSRNGPAKVLAPGPRVSKPELRQEVQRGGFRPAIHGGDSDEHVFDVSFGVFDEKVEITVPGKSAGIEQFEFRLATAAALALFNQGFIRKSRLRILVEHAHVTVSGRGIEV